MHFLFMYTLEALFKTPGRFYQQLEVIEELSKDEKIEARSCLVPW